MIVRQLQLLLPGVRIWLDVDCLDDVGMLEESVQRSLTAIIFLSRGYFASKNCAPLLAPSSALLRALTSQRLSCCVRQADENCTRPLTTTRR